VHDAPYYVESGPRLSRRRLLQFAHRPVEVGVEEVELGQQFARARPDRGQFAPVQ
jgi:hypothetical protein